LAAVAAHLAAVAAHLAAAAVAAHLAAVAAHFAAFAAHFAASAAHFAAAWCAFFTDSFLTSTPSVMNHLVREYNTEDTQDIINILRPIESPIRALR
jgi:uncharacterized protein (DUF697 family)